MAGSNPWGRPQRRLFIGVALPVVTVALSGAAYSLLLGNDQGAVFTSFLFQDGSEEWLPIDIARSIDNIEALQQMENRGLANMILELDRDPGSRPTDEELERLWTLYRESFEVAEREGWFVYANAVRAGFSYDENDPTHYPNDKNLGDDRDLAPDRPEFLMFYPDPDDEAEKVLVGFMFQESTFDAHGEQIGGSLSRWHKHIYGQPVCFDQSLVPHGTHVPGRCNGVPSSASPEMLHVWFVDHPLSSFASEMTIHRDLIEKPVMLTRDAFMAKHRSLVESGPE
jgi:hypothetical protein